LRVHRPFVPILSMAALFCLGGEAFAGDLKSASERTLLAELYTCEAYRGAAPAAAWVSSFMDSPDLWTRVVPAAFHVDYGDKPGRWKDRFAHKAYTDRLVAYASKWGLRAPYVPTVVLNGEEWSGWAREEAVPSREPERVGVLTARVGGVDEVFVTFDPEDKTHKSWVAHAALLGFGLSSKVDGGENLGKTLKHDFVVLHKSQKALVNVRDLYRGGVKIRLKPDLRTSALAVVVWVTRADNPLPVQCVGGYTVLPVKKTKKITPRP
jgi:hypothetical protein